MIRWLFALTAILMSFQESYAQTQSFPEEPDKFIIKYESFLTRGKKSSLEALAEQLVEKWETDAFDDAHKASIIYISNTMLHQKMRTYPHFEEYLEGLLHMHEFGHMEHFDQWHGMLHHVIATAPKGSNRPFEHYLQMSGPLFKDNVIYTSQARTWKANNHHFDLKYDVDSLPIVTFEQLNLSGITRGDTVVIQDTRGIYYPLDFRWEGHHGRVTWERAGLDPNSVYCDLKKYELNTKQSKYEADSVALTHYLLSHGGYTGVLTGTFSDKLMANYDPEHANYPQFKPYQADVTLNDLAANVDYNGGFALEGSKVIGEGTEKEPAQLIFYDNDKVRFHFRARRFVIQRLDRIVSSRSSMALYLGEDSIYHPGAEIKFDIENELLTIKRGKHGGSATAFLNTFHMLDMEVESLRWEAGSDKIKMDMLLGAGEVDAIFESLRYFSQQLFDDFQGIMSYNPISKIKMYAEKYDTKEMYSDELAKFMNPNLSVEQIRSLLYKLVEFGFIYYDQEIELVKVRPKTFNYVYANADMIDYDYIRVKSATENKTHGILNLDNFDLKVFGVPFVVLSRKHEVVVIPENKTVIFKQNRNMEFDRSKTIAGRMEFFGKNVSFNYGSYKMSLGHIDSLRFKLEHDNLRDQYGNPATYQIKSVLEDLNANLLIDEPDNKSGRHDYPEYPKLESTKPSYVYYDKSHIHNGLYTRDRFYFELDPFKFDSLNTFTGGGIAFDGTFVSAGIFPDFRETLKLQPDTSLGFLTETPAEGYPAYKGKGKYDNTIHLSNKGLRGKGKVEYLESTTQSNDIVFYPDSMLAQTEMFALKQTRIYPDVKGEDVYTQWKPYSDEMHVSSQETPLSLYAGEATLDGTGILTPTTFRGDGSLKLAYSVMNSNNFAFQTNSFKADSLDLRLYAPDDPEIEIFHAHKVKSQVSIEKGHGTFTSQSGELLNEFTANQYLTSMDKFNWDIPGKHLTFETTSPTEKPYFLSSHKNQDSLRFHGTTGTFDIPSKLLTVNGVEYIPVADAKIYPDSQLVYIEPEAKMRRLDSATVKADTSNYFHTFYDAAIHVKGKYHYSGSGMYDYINASKKPQTIEFKRMRTKEDAEGTWRTYAEGNISVLDTFEINPNIGFKGGATVHGPREHLLFKGYSKINFDNEYLPTQWFSFADTIDPFNFSIHLETPVNENQEALYSGIHLGYETPHMYPTFLNTKKSRMDHDLITVEGRLEQDEGAGAFNIGDEEKLFNDERKGHYLRFTPKLNLFYVEGPFDLGLDYKELVTLKSAGNCVHKLNYKSYDFNLILSMAFYFNDEAMDHLHEELTDVTYDMPAIDYDRSEFLNAIAELTTERELRNIQNELHRTGSFSPPDALKGAQFVFTDLSMAWDTVTQSYRSIEPLGLGHINGNSVNRKVEGYLEFGKKRSGDFFNLYLQGESRSNWYFFTYKNGMLNVFSSSKPFIDKIMEEPNRKRKTRSESGNLYRYSGSMSTRRMEQFVKSMEIFLDPEGDH